MGAARPLTLHSQPIWYRWFRLFFWVGLSESQVDTKSQSVMCILPLPSDLPGERPDQPLRGSLPGAPGRNIDSGCLGLSLAWGGWRPL